MTVGELMERLKDFDADLPIVVWDHDWHEYIEPEYTFPFIVEAVRHIGKDENENYIEERFQGLALD